ncbi:sensor histidine kinase [Rugamonas rivuli]|uniref:Sensor histidine kinase n=1 Tax=Rugamonas rivuli TaxID=2743358 RepID=A0A843SDB4_9BURK|nr:histidine kinase [Rugamonas rivuli]MQA20160.1 sensor histidine kinase [Rugamonas rivuli]
MKKSIMITLTPPSRSRWRRFADDLVLTILLNTCAGVLVDLVFGQRQELYSQVVYSLTVGVVAVAIIDGARLLLGDHPAQRRRWRMPLLALGVASALVGHFSALLIGGLVMGDSWPAQARYPAWKFHTVLFALLSVGATMLLILSRERLERISAERGEARARADAVERQALQAQLRLLQAQIEPHMLFNTLANLQGLIERDPRQATHMLGQLILYLRANLAATRCEHIALAQEFDAIAAYLALMNMRMGERLRYHCVLPDPLRAAQLPPMLLQPLVENAIVHGLEPKIEGGEIAVVAAERDGALQITVIDTGLGLPDAAAMDADDSRGVGVGTTRERLQVLYGERASLVLAAHQPHGVLARLTLPLEFA